MRSQSLQRLMLLSVGLLPIAYATQVSAQIPSSRVTDWHNSGVVGGIPTGGTEILATNYGVIANDGNDDSAAIQALVNNSISLNKVIKFPVGVIRCDNRIDFPSAGNRVIRGTINSTARTEFHFYTGAMTNGKSGNFNVRSGAYSGSAITVNSGFTKGSKQLVLASSPGWQANDYIELRQENEISLMNTGRENDHLLNPPQPRLTWADMNYYNEQLRAVGQLFQIESVNGSIVNLKKPLRLNYNKDSLNQNVTLSPKVQKFTPTQRVGFEDFDVRSINGGTKSAIGFTHAANCWVKNVRSYMSVSNHVSIASSLNMSVRNSHFDNAHFHGGGGNGYGVALGDRTTDSLVENNSFANLRHSMLTNMGANGNVFGYNRSWNTTNVTGQLSVSPDISVHGHFSYMNLFEGNDVEYVYSGDWWGPSGPGTTFFRNRVKLMDLHIDDRSLEQNVVGNQVISPNKIVRAPSSGSKAVRSPFIHGNETEYGYTWATGYPQHVQDSYYKADRPGFLSADKPWPLFGPRGYAMQREVWNNIVGGVPTDIANSGPPSAVTALTTVFEAPSNQGDNYLSRIKGYITVPATGGYLFWVAGDDRAELYISTDGNPSNKTKIAHTDTWTASREWSKNATQMSALVYLTAGQRIYLEANHSENTGSDHIAVGWKLPNQTYELPIPASRFVQ